MEQSPYRVLITGSVRPTPAEIVLAQRAVGRAAERGYTVLVNDLPGVNRAVVDACNRLDVRYACVHLGSQARNKEARVGVRAPATCRYSRDRWIVDQADRVFGIYHRTIGSDPVVVQYAKAKGKPADVVTPRAIAPISTPLSKTATVQAIIDTRQGESGLVADIGLLALDGGCTVLKTARLTLPLLCVHSDHARLEAVVAVMKHLSGDGDKLASYTLHIEQSSSRVVRWLQGHYQGSHAQVQILIDHYSSLKSCFGEVMVSQADRAAIRQRLEVLSA